MDPVHIFVGGEELRGWTEMSLQRSKENMTGSLSISMFFSYVPDSPVAINATKNKDVTVYIGGQLAFTGKIDRRQGSGVKHGQTGSDDNTAGEDTTSRSASISADEYTVKLTARGKTKFLIESSHQHPTTNMLKPTNLEAFEKLIAPWGLEMDWKASTIKLDKLRLRDGAKVIHEIQRLAEENGHFVYETRDGKLRITDDTGREEGEPLILGENVMTFSAEQSEEDSKKKVKVKGQRTEKGIRGAKAVLNIEKEIEDSWVEGNLPFIIQHYGDGTPEALERRANFETNKRSSAAKKLTIEVFHVQSSNGEPWDIGTLHYCEIPPEGIFDVFECTELTYSVQNDKTIKTTLTLSPPPSNTAGTPGGAGAAANAAGLTGLGGVVDAIGGAVIDTVSGAVGGLVGGVVGGAVSGIAGTAAGNLAGLVAQGAARRAAAGITIAPGQYPAPWSGPVVSIVQPPLAQDLVGLGLGLLSSLNPDVEPPPAALPAGFQTRDTK